MSGPEWNHSDPDHRDDPEHLNLSTGAETDHGPGHGQAQEHEGRQPPAPGVVRIPTFARARAQTSEPAMDPESPASDTDESPRPGLLRRLLGLASKIPLPSLGSERHEMGLDAPEPAMTTTSEPAGVEGEAAASPAARPGSRFPFLSLKNEMRVGIAALLSVVLLVTALIFKSGGGGKTPPEMALSKPTEGAPSGDKKDENKPKGEPEPKPKGEPEKAPTKAEPAKDPVPATVPEDPGPTDPVPLDTPGSVATLATNPAGADPVAMPPTGPDASKPAALATTSPPSLPETPSAGIPELPATPGPTPLPPDTPASPQETTPTPTPTPVEPGPATPPVMPIPAPTPNPSPTPAPTPPPSAPSATEPMEAPPVLTESPRPRPSSPVAPPAPVPAEKAPALESIPAASAVEPSAARASTAGALGVGWVAIPSGGRRIVGAGPIVSTPMEFAATTPARIADGPRAADDRSIADQIEPVVHVVRSGENFWTISRLYYRDGRFYRALHSANLKQVPDIRKLYVGTVLRIPPPEALDRSLIDPPSGSNAEDLAPSPAKRAEPRDEADLALPAPARPRVIRPSSDPSLDPDPAETRRRPTYKVKAHETLRSIARDTLDDPRRAREIYTLNREVLGDSDVLTAGTTLTLPEDANVGRRPR